MDRNDLTGEWYRNGEQLAEITEVFETPRSLSSLTRFMLSLAGVGLFAAILTAAAALT